MKLNQTLLVLIIAGGLGLAGEAKANIIYDVNLTVGTGGVVGSLTTDGTIGTLAASDILAWNFTITGNGGATFNLVNGPSGVAVRNSSDPSNPNAGTPDLTADANNIYFNFGATDGGFLLFQQTAFYSTLPYWACCANNNNVEVLQGLSVVPENSFATSSIYQGESGNQTIASVATSAVPEPTTVVAAALLLLPLGAGLLRKRQVA